MKHFDKYSSFARGVRAVFLLLDKILKEKNTKVRGEVNATYISKTKTKTRF